MANQLIAQADSELDHRIIYVAHTDQQVIDLLMKIEQHDGVEHVNAQELQKVCHMFSQETIFNFLLGKKGSKLTDIVLLV